MAKNPIARTSYGRVKFHAAGCWVNGGPGLPGRVACPKCADDADSYYERLLMALDRRAGRR